MPASTNQAHYNSVLTDISVNYTPPDLVARELLKPVNVTHENDVYPVFDKSGFDIENDLRADGAEANETDLGWKYVPYQCEEHALKTVLTKRQMDNADDPADLEARKTENVKQKVLNRLENLVFGTGGFARNTSNVINARNFDWSNSATAAVRRDVDLLKEDVETASGVTPNTIVLTPQAARGIMRTAEWRDEAKYTNDLRSDNDIPTQFYGLNVITVGSLYNTGRKGQTRTLGRMMGDDVLVCYIAPGGLSQNVLTWAALLYTEEYAAKWYDDNRRAWLIEYGYIYVPQLVAKECAALGQSVLTP
jgi:hypothetical protein